LHFTNKLQNNVIVKQLRLSNRIVEVVGVLTTFFHHLRSFGKVTL